MARINPLLFEKLLKKLDVKPRRAYEMISEKAAELGLPRNLAAIRLAHEHRINVHPYVSADEWSNLVAAGARSLRTTTAPVEARAMNRVRKKIKETRVDRKKIFVVYGRNENARRAVFEFLRSLELKPLEWNHLVLATRQGSPYILATIEKGLASAAAVVSLFTPDDEARLKKQFRRGHEKNTERDLMGQPRPNVLFEAGLAFGLHPERTILVSIGALRDLSDLAGKHVVRLDNSQEKRQEFVVKLQAVGCDLNDSGSDWHRAGDFEHV